MKALILAAGMGNRMGKYTKDIPKALLSFNGKSLLEWQVMQLRKAGYSDICIVTGYKHYLIDLEGLTYYHNSNYAFTNMIESLMCAQDELTDGILVSYADILFDQNLLGLIRKSQHDIGVVADRNWRNYWKTRYGTTEHDLESFSVRNGFVSELGRHVDSSTGIDYRYVGLINFSTTGIQKALEVYKAKKLLKESWLMSGNRFEQGYMTDLLNELILKETNLSPIVCSNGWLEFDTEEDYEKTNQLLSEGLISNSFFE